jgi:xanthine dehydrogenase YagR molybdenum-binding subunit
MTATPTHALGAPLARVEGREKVTGAARYAYEYQAEQVAYAWIVGAEITRGRITGFDMSAVPSGARVLTYENTPELQEVDDQELAVLQ